MSPRGRSRSGRRPPLAPPLLACALALCAGCGANGRELETGEHADPSEEIEVPEGMEEWAHLLGHNTPDQDAPDWTGRREGLTTLWHDNGVKEGEGRYDGNHRRSGPWTFWYENGVKRWEGTYEDGEVVGLERSWFEDGTPQYEGAYVDGKRDGPWRTWRRGGRLMWEGHFSAGKRHGVYRTWRPDGSLDPDESGVYRYGKRTGDAAPDPSDDPPSGAEPAGG